MLAAERGAGPTRWRRIAATLPTLPRYLAGAGATVKSRDDRGFARAISARSRGAALRPASVARRLSAIRQLYRFLYAEGSARTIPPPCSKARSARARCRRLSRSPKSIGCCGVAARCDPAAPLSERLRAARLACLVETPLRHRPACLRTRRPAGFGGAPRRPRHRRARQGQQGTPGAAQRCGQARDGGLPRTARRGRGRRRRRRGGTIEMAVPLIRRAAAISRASTSPASSRRWRRPPDCARRR